MTYDVCIEDFILMTTEDREEAITTMYEIIDGEASIDATRAWVNVMDEDEWLATIEDSRGNAEDPFNDHIVSVEIERA